MSDTDTVVLDASVDPHPELHEHPVDLTEQDIANGLLMWQEIDDLDDHDNGVDLHVPHGPVATSSGYLTAQRRAGIVRECLLRHGVPEVSIELREGRPTYGEDPWNACQPVSLLSHHIASVPSVYNPTPGLALVKVGRSDLPGPLANGTAGVDLVYRILTMGWANHPGEGGPWTVSGPMGTYTVPRDVARPYAWGTEFEGGYSDAVWDATYTNRRTGISMTFREFMGRVNAGLAEAIWLINGRGRTPEPGDDLSGYHGEHKTWAPGRKPDRLNYTTETGRAEIKRYNQEDDVSAKDVWEYEVPVYDGTGGDDRKAPARVVLAQAHNRAENARKVARSAVDQVKALRKIVVSLSEHLGDDEAAAKVKADIAALGPVPEVDETPDGRE